MALVVPSFIGTSGEAIDRQELIIMLKIDTKFYLVGKESGDFGINIERTKTEKTTVYGVNKTITAKPIKKSSISAEELTVGNKVHEWVLAHEIEGEQSAFDNVELLIIYGFYPEGEGKAYAELHKGSSISFSNLTGAGGGKIAMDSEVTYSGDITRGSVPLVDIVNAPTELDVTKFSPRTTPTE